MDFFNSELEYYICIMSSYKYNILSFSSKVIKRVLEETNKIFKLKFYKNKLLNYTNIIDTFTPYKILFSLKLILSYSNTRARTLFYFYINNIKFIFIYNNKLNYSGLCIPDKSITINIAQCGYTVNDIKSCIIHELVHFFDKELIKNNCKNYQDVNSDYEYCINRFEIPAFLMEAWFRYRIHKNGISFFRETFKQSLNNILHSYLEDNDADKAYEYYIDKIQNDSLLNKRYGHLI